MAAPEGRDPDAADGDGVTPYYEHDGITLYHGDCREVILQLTERVATVITDPPYGIQRDKGFGKGGRGFSGHGRTIFIRSYNDDWDSGRPDEKTFLLMLGTCDLAVIWGGNFFADILPQSTHWIVWDKLQTMPTFSDCELAWTNSKRKSVSKVTVEYNGLIGKEKYRAHPTQKPLQLMAWCVSHYSKEGDTILDPFMGSGTTLEAAKKLHRKAIGIELEKKYCDIAIERLSQEVMDFK